MQAFLLGIQGSFFKNQKNRKVSREKEEATVRHVSQRSFEFQLCFEKF